MAWTRIGQIGWELNDVAEAPAWRTGPGSNYGSISATVAKTGTYSYRAGNTFYHAPGFSFSSATYVRFGAWVYHSGLSGTTNDGTLIRMGETETACALIWDASQNDLDLVINSSVVDSVSAADFAPTDVWYHLAMVCFADSSNGWASVYLDGVQILNATSQNTTSGFASAYIGDTGQATYGNYIYYDDLVCDTGTAESDAAMELSRFYWSIADGNGTNSAWTGSDGDSVNNYLLVDDTTPDDDTTYVKAASAALKDTYQCAATSLPAGSYVIDAAIPTALVKRTSTTEQIKMLAYDGASTTTGSAQDPDTDYAPIWERMTTQPDSSSWNETDFNAMEFGYESDGTY